MSLFLTVAGELAEKYLAGLTPDQIRVELPKWLDRLNTAQFSAARTVMVEEEHRRRIRTIASIGNPR